MNILAFDTCFGACSVAMGFGTGADVIETLELRDQGHAERLMPMIAGLLERSGGRIQDFDRIAVTLGPGTFTGMRIGIAAARAFALAAELEVVGTTSLAVMAHEIFATEQAGPEDRLLVVQDARREAVYAEMFLGSALRSDGGANLLPIDAAVGLAETSTVIAGTGVELIRASFSSGPRHCKIAVPSAKYLLDLAPSLVPLENVSPIYLRPADAKPQSAGVLPRL